MRAQSLGIAFLLAITPTAAADILALKDGRFVDEVRVQKTEGGYHLNYNNGQVFVPEDLVKDCLIEREDGGFEPRNEEERAKAEKGLVPFEGKWVTKVEREKFVAKRTAEKKKKLEEAKAHLLWRNRYITQGKNFDFEYTINPEIFENLKNLMETYYTVFTKKWGITRPAKLGKLKVCFYHDYKSFLQVGGAGYGVIGYYRFVPPLELNFFYEGSDPLETMEVMFHEANHYLTHLIDLDFHYPHNINEAMAEYYGASRWDPEKKEMSVGHILEGRLTEVLTDIQGGDWKKLDDYLQNKLGYDDYTWGWTFVHYMMETPKYSKKFQNFFIALAKGKDVKRKHEFRGSSVEGPEILAAFKKYMGVNDIDALEKEWHEYIKSKLTLETHRGYEQAGLSAMRTGQSIKAKRFFKLAIEKGSTSSIVYNNYADLLRREDKNKEAAELLRKAILFNPLNGENYADLAQCLLRLGGDKNKEESKRLMALAKEVDPENRRVLVIEVTIGEEDEPGD